MSIPGDPLAETGPPALVHAEEEISTPHRRRLAFSTAIFSLATGLSRVLGLIREIVAAYYFGVAGKINAFTVAFQIPNLMRSLVADQALSSAFIPVFSELLVRGNRARAWRVASSVFWLMLLGLGGLTALSMLAAPLLIKPFGNPGGDPQLAVGLARVLFPIVVLLGLSGVVVGILNAYEEFAIPALTPVAWNLAIILGLVLGVPNAKTLDAKLYVYAFSVLIGTVIQVLLPLPWLRGLDGHLHLALDWRDPAVRQVFILMIPVSFGLGLINFNAVVDTLFASRLIDPQLAPSAIDKAFRLYMLPQGMFSVAVATVLFPSLSRAAARGDDAGFRDTVALGMRQIVFLLVPASALLAVLAEPIVELVYQHGAFRADQTPVVGACLAAFTLGLTFNGGMLILNRAFFSLQSPWVPTLVALGNLGLNAVLDAAFYPLGAWGIPLSTSLVNIAGVGALLWLLRQRIGPIGLGRTLQATARVCLASGIVAGLSYLVWRLLDHRLGGSLAAEIAEVGVALLFAVSLYLFLCGLLRIREVDALLSLKRRRQRR